MSLKKIEQVKADKGFKIWDLIIYVIIAVLVAVLLTVVFTAFNREPLTGIRISAGSRTTLRYDLIFEYEFGGEVKVYSDTVSVEEDGKGLKVTVKTENNGINVIYIDKTKKTAEMINANCRSKDCMMFLPMSDNSDSITCNSHGIKVEPIFQKDWDDPNQSISK